MEKPANTNYPIQELLARRWSPRVFSSRAVEVEKLRSLLEAARWAASCYNDQPWFYMVATKENAADYDQLLNCLVEGNREWARSAPVLMLSVARLTFAYNGKPNAWAFHDVGQAAANLCIQATALGLQVHQMAGFDAEKARTSFAIPQGFDPVAAFVIGYPGDPATLPEKLREREMAPRSRKSLAECVFTGRWGRTSPVLGISQALAESRNP